MRKLWPLWLVAALVVGLAWAGDKPVRTARAAGPPPMPAWAYLEVNPGVPPQWDNYRFVRLQWAMPPDAYGTVTHFILESAFDPDFRVFPSHHVLPIEQVMLDGWQHLLGVPEQDGVAYYYRIWACNEAGCSLPRWIGVVARRVWPDPNSWNFYVACSWGVRPEPLPSPRYQLIFGCSALNLSPIQRCDFAFYDGVAGYGGILRVVSKSGEGCLFPGVPGGVTWEDVAWPPPYVSVGQRFGPWEVAVAVKIPGL